MDLQKSSIYKRLNFLNRFFAKVTALKASDAFLYKGVFLACVIFLLLFLIQWSQAHTVVQPTTGGTFTEGIVGTPRFVNPVLAVTRADKDLTALIYDGLMSLGKDGVLVPNIAESITASEDGLTYNVILKQNILFQDGTPLTAADVAFTISRIQDPLLASPLRASFDGVKVEEVGEYELNLVLPEPYAPFIENLTFGIPLQPAKQRTCRLWTVRNR
jgi:peptide/nickel transport system substrate-binding protein